MMSNNILISCPIRPDGEGIIARLHVRGQEKVYAEQVVMYCSTNEIVSKVSFRDFKFRFEKFQH